MPSIRTLTVDDIDQADRVLRAAFAVPTSYVPRLSRYLAIAPDGWFVATDGDAIVGTVGVMDYASFAYIGLMAVSPGQQSRGVGRRLLDHALAWAAARGIDAAMLDATDDGARLYEQLGFVDAGVTYELAAPTPVPAPAPIDGVAPARSLDAVIALDAALFGVRRAALWRRLADELPGRILVAHDRDGALRGYVCAQPRVIGPWGARDQATAEALLDSALAFGTERRVLVPDGSPARALLARRGFQESRRLRHMRRGAIDGPAWTQIYGKASYCVG